MKIFIFLLFLGPLNALADGCFSQLSQTWLRAKQSLRTYQGKIDHADYYLWDNWGLVDEQGIEHVYAMAAPRYHGFRDRHQHAHWRHFTSKDQGKNWIEQGEVLRASNDESSFAGKAIWSGSVIQLKSGEFLAGFTGLSHAADFLQAISLASSKNGHNFSPLFQGKALLDHKTQRKLFLKNGYYVDQISRLGSKHGEANGSIQSLRDPFLLEGQEGLHLFWSAKAYQDGKVVSAIGHAILSDYQDPKSLKILSPIIPPDGGEFTQLELPNVIVRADGSIEWIISTTNRVSEETPEHLVEAHVRRYTSKTLNSELEIEGDHSIIFSAPEIGVYGLNVIRENSKHGASQAGRRYRVFDQKELTIDYFVD